MFAFLSNTIRAFWYSGYTGFSLEQEACSQLVQQDQAFPSAYLSYSMKEASYLYVCWPIVLASSPSCLHQRKKKKKPYWLHRFIQPEGNSLKRATAPTGGPSSVQTELPLPEKAARQSGRQVEQETGPCMLRPLCVSRQACVLYSVKASRDTQSGMSVAPAGTSRCFLGIVVPPLW